MKKLNFLQMLSISMTLFAMFFGAGNMIFPPAMGQQAGTNFFWALLGFIVTDAGIAILGITAVVLTGDSMKDLGSIVDRRFAKFLAILVYLLIGPLFALPRTGTVSLELAILPFIDSEYALLCSVLFTAVFFGITYFLSSNPKKIVDIVGKMLTPILLISIGAIFVASLLHVNSGADMGYGIMQVPNGEYASIPFFKGMIEGYNALDGPAGLAFAIIVISAIQNYGVTEKKQIAKYTVLCGLGSAFLLSIVYFALTYTGAITGMSSFSNGGALLSAVANLLFGNVGAVILGIAVLLACLTTSIGLTTSFADYFSEEYPHISYKKIAGGVCLFSFLIANIGLNQLIAVSLPVLIMIYPVSVVLLVLSFFREKIGGCKMVYILGMLFTLAVSFMDGLANAGISLGALSGWTAYLPFQNLGLGWVLPAVLGSLIGFLPFLNKKVAE